MQIYLCLNLINAYRILHYSFKIFLCFWLTKITRIIHHNQLLLTKFGKFLPFWTDDVKSAVKMQIYLCLNLINAFFTLIYKLNKRIYKILYYSFKIFRCFWLTKITRIIHHNQLLLTKFGKFLPYWTDDVKSAVKMQVIEPLTEKTWGQPSELSSFTSASLKAIVIVELLHKMLVKFNFKMLR